MSDGRGHYRQMLLEQQLYRDERKHVTEEEDQYIFSRIRFYISLVLFVCYVLLDYNGSSLQQLSSQNIQSVIAKDYTASINFETNLTQLISHVLERDPYETISLSR